MNLDIWVIIGVGLIIVGLILIILASQLYDNIESFGVIIIGPFPIIFGYGKKYMKYLIPIALVLLIIYVVLFLNYGGLSRKYLISVCKL